MEGGSPFGYCIASNGPEKGYSASSAKLLRILMPLPQANQAGRIVRFGIFEVDLAAGELRKSGVRVRLQEQPFQVRAYLLQHPGELGTRARPRQKLCAAATYTDFESRLGRVR